VSDARMEKLLDTALERRISLLEDLDLLPQNPDIMVKRQFSSGS